MTTQEERTGSSPGAAADVQVRVPRRPKSWGSKVRWTRHTVQAALVAVVGWQAVGHVTSGGESAQAWCPLGGIEGAWTVLTTGRTVAHVHTSSLVLAATVLVLATKGATLDEQGRAMLAEDLRSPCTEEVAVFQAFSRVINESRRHFVVVDTAPTGHTLLLLDATGSYHREVVRQLGENVHFTTPLMRLQNPEETKVILITLAEKTPVLEANGLQDELERANIHPWAWVVNNSLAAAAPTSPLLRRRAACELTEIDTVTRDHTQRYAVVPMLATEPVGITALAALSGTRGNALVP